MPNIQPPIWTNRNLNDEFDDEIHDYNNPLSNDQNDNVSVDRNSDRSNSDDGNSDVGNSDDGNSDDGSTNDVTTDAGTTDEPLIDNTLAVDPEELDPLAMIKNEVPSHEEDIVEFADDIMREEVEFERVDDDVFICVEGEVPLPFINTLQFKKNDELSGNRPCYDFVSKFFDV